jgi:carbon-monoxide dehydrogenase small subunit
MAAIDLVRHGDGLDRPSVRRGLEGTLCRCTGYHHIVDAVMDAAAATRDAASEMGHD